MKNVLKLGKALSKAEQKEIAGGTGRPGPGWLCCEWCPDGSCLDWVPIGVQCPFAPPCSP
ncbi:hypothetical protein [Winogradskyella sp.]|uniref:hypothetical protein n=1 Tax=Winogradskyella sp. TaxID=1883156 RepID=UPI00322ED0AC